MSTTPSFRLPISIPDDVHPSIKEALTTHDNELVDISQAIVALNGKITTSTKTSSSATTAAVTSASETIIENASATVSTVGQVNNQVGETAYTSQQSDYGAFVILGDSFGVAVTLSVTGSIPRVTTPWYCVYINSGSASAVLTPVSGTINGASSYTLTSGNSVTVAFDGTNFWTEVATGGGGGGVTAVTASSPLASSGGTMPNLTFSWPSAIPSGTTIPWSQVTSQPTIPAAQVAANLASSGSTGVTGTLPASQVGSGYPAANIASGTAPISVSGTAANVTATSNATLVTLSALTTAAGGAFASGAFATAYVLPTASTSVLGGVKVDGSTITISGGVISASNPISGLTSGTIPIATSGTAIGNSTITRAAMNSYLRSGSTAYVSANGLNTTDSWTATPTAATAAASFVSDLYNSSSVAGNSSGNFAHFLINNGINVGQISGNEYGLATFVALTGGGTNSYFIYDGGGNLSQLGGLIVSGSGTAVLSVPNGSSKFGGGVIGYTAGSAASSGIVGEVGSTKVAVGSATSLTTATAKSVASVALSAGDWEVSGNVNFTASSATTALGATWSAGINTSAALPTDGTEVPMLIPLITTTSFKAGISLPTKQINVSSSTTVYLVGEATFTAGTVGGYGEIRARRIR